jgi:ComEC/Rec2-related protein
MQTTPHRASFNPHPLALLAATFACGVLLARFTQSRLTLFIACGALCSALAFVAFVRARSGVATLLLCAAFLCVGAGLEVVEREGVPRDRVRRFYEGGRLESGDAVELTGVVARAPEVAPDGFYVELRVEAIRHFGGEEGASGVVELFAPVRDLATLERYELLELRRGARVRVLTRLERAEEFRNLGVNSLTEFLERRGLEAVGAIKSPLLVERLDDEPVFVPLVWLERWRARVHGRMTEEFTPETAGVLQAAILGNRHGLSHATAEAMREGGTFHVLVISGLHISFIGGLALLVARKVTRSRAAQFASSACLLWAYAVAVGAEVSVVRAALMFTLVALAPLVARRSASLNALGTAAVALLAWRPAELFDPSFQLTFLSVLGIVTLGWPLVERLRETGAWRPTRETPYPPAAPRWWRALGESLYWSERAWEAEQLKQTHSCRLFKTAWAGRLERWRVQRVLRYAAAAVVVSAGVQLMLLPLLVVYFHRLSVASLVLNVYVGALAAAAALGALAALVVSSFSATLAAPLVWAVERAVWLMAQSTAPFGEAASVRPPEYAGALSFVYALYYLPLAALVASLARWRPLEPPANRREGEGKETDRRGHRQAATAGASRVTAAQALAARGEGGATTSRDEATVRDEATARDESSGARSRWGGRLRARFGRLTTRAPVRRAAWASCALATFVVVAHPLSAPRADGRLRVDFLDVGQGDAALLTLPDGTTMLVDAGGRPRFGERRAASDSRSPSFVATEAFERDARGVGERVVSEFLWRRGLDRVDYLLATHAHADHVQGLGDVARAFRVRAALVGRAQADEPEFAEFDAALRRAGVPLQLVGRGDVLRAGGATLEVLWPPRATVEGVAPRASPARAASGNDDSVVLRVRFGRRCFLLTGDIERRAEGALLAAGDDLRCDVVKVAHHGSKTSSNEEFVAATRAAFAVIPVGIDSPFSHPDPQVVARWRAAGAEILQTGRRGTVSFTTDGERLSFETFVRE